MDVIDIISAVLAEYRETVGGHIALAEITSERKGRSQPSDVPGVSTEWVEQFGDEAAGVPYHGNVYIELAPGRYGRFEYQT
jgi:hypothetical protein